MAIFKCKMCGGTLEITGGETVATCEYCGTKQTLPKTDDDVISTLFNRANNLRLKCEFDKAAQIYEKIVEQDSAQAEAYWGIVLCKYGIEYVEDPKTMGRIPTCHRTLFEAVTADADYLAAVEHADAAQRGIYEAEARAIDILQKDILAIVKNEKPFDVFLCYKETDEYGKRTVDSAIANDIYHQLTQEGFKVFYAAITLEDKLGTAYEPYIFAALNSAKVMLVLGTKPEYFTAVWVKNEWSRFLHLMKTDRSKLLIPCYRDMDAYDLPEEFAHLQAQDMSKIGFINDVVRGIKKVAQTAAPAPAVVKETVVAGGNTNVAPLLKRAFMFLEDGEWDRADEFCEQVLNIDPECADAYLGKLMAELHVRKQEALKEQTDPFDDRNTYQKAVRFADDALKMTLNGYIEHINTRNENARLEDIYMRAVNAMETARTESEYDAAATIFATIKDYKDASLLMAKCVETADMVAKDAVAKEALAQMRRDDVYGYEMALKLWQKISGWKDADEQVAVCKQMIEEIKEQSERTAKRNKKIALIVTVAICLFSTVAVVVNTVIIPNSQYNDALELMQEGKYGDAIAVFQMVADYKDSTAKMAECQEAISSGQYNDAVKLMEAKSYSEAIEIFEALGDYKDSSEKRDQCIALRLEESYTNAVTLLQKKQYPEAVDIFMSLGEYKDSVNLKNRCYLEGAKHFYANKDYNRAKSWYEFVDSYNKNEEFYLESCYRIGVDLLEQKQYQAAASCLEKAGQYSGAKSKLNEAQYAYVIANKNNHNVITLKYLKELKTAKYKDSASIYTELYGWKITSNFSGSLYDKTSDLSSFEIYDPVYCHAKLSGGEPGEKIIVKYTVKYPGGSTNSDQWDSEWGDGYSGYVYWDDGLSSSGTLYITFYDENGNKIGSDSVKITHW